MGRRCSSSAKMSTAMLQVLDDGVADPKLTHGYRRSIPSAKARYISTTYPIRAELPRLDFSESDPKNRQRKKNFDSIEFIFGEADISDLSGQTVLAEILIDGVVKQAITLRNITTTRVLRPLKCGDGYDWAIRLSTSSVVSAASATPVLVPDVVSAGPASVLAPRVAGSPERARLMARPLYSHTLNLRTSSPSIARQTIGAPGDTILPATLVWLSAAGPVTLTSTPTIAHGVDGQRCLLVNTTGNVITIQDRGTLANSTLVLNAPTRSIGVDELVYNATVGGWFEISHNF